MSKIRLHCHLHCHGFVEYSKAYYCCKHHIYLYQFDNQSQFSTLLVQWVSDKIISYRNKRWSLVLRGTISQNCNTVKKMNSKSSEVAERNSTNRRDNITCVTVPQHRCSVLKPTPSVTCTAKMRWQYEMQQSASIGKEMGPLKWEWKERVGEAGVQLISN